MFSIVVTIVLILNLFAIIAVIFLERRNPVTTMAWLLALTTMPLVGFFLYLLFGRGFTSKKALSLQKQEERFVKRIVDRQLGDLSGGREVNATYKQLMQLNLKVDQALCTNNNEVKIYTDGKEKYEDLLRDLQEAKQYIHLLYFIIGNDQIGEAVFKVIKAKKEEGLEVNVLFDALGQVKDSMKVYKKYKKAGIEVNMFSPLKATASLKANYRNHRKLVIIDGEIGYIGGMNLSDSYQGMDKRLKPWRDTHLRIVGGAVALMEMRFILDYRHVSGRRMEHMVKYFQRKEHFTGTVPIQIVSSGPHETTENIKLTYVKMIQSAKNYVYIQTPYFIPDASFLDAIRIACYSGNDVRIMIPGLPDKRFVYKGTLSYVEELLEMGARVFCYNGFLHAKAIVVDDKMCSIGSANMDIRSFKISFESNAIMYDQGVAEAYRVIFLEDEKHCKEILLEEFKKRSWFERIEESLSRLLSPLL